MINELIVSKDTYVYEKTGSTHSPTFYVNASGFKVAYFVNVSKDGRDLGIIVHGRVMSDEYATPSGPAIKFEPIYDSGLKKRIREVLECDDYICFI